MDITISFELTRDELNLSLNTDVVPLIHSATYDKRGDVVTITPWSIPQNTRHSQNLPWLLAAYKHEFYIIQF